MSGQAVDPVDLYERGAKLWGMAFGGPDELVGAAMVYMAYKAGIREAGLDLATAPAHVREHVGMSPAEQLEILIEAACAGDSSAALELIYTRFDDLTPEQVFAVLSPCRHSVECDEALDELLKTGRAREG